MLLIYSSFATAIAISVGLYQFLRTLSKRKHLARFESSYASDNKALIVTSHPDDECMFFAPTITGLQENGWEVFLLCISNGNYNGLGSVREREIVYSCNVLGIRQERCTVVNHSLLPDHPTKHWDSEVLASIIAESVITQNISAVITFDDYGVSGHINHRSMAPALRRFIEKWHLDSVHVYLLESVPIWRKYTLLLDAMYSYATGDITYMSSLSQFYLGQRAMCQHRSQLVWFRWLYMALSRYMYINTLVPLQPHSLSKQLSTHHNSTSSDHQQQTASLHSNSNSNHDNGS